jgi:hypothetical protein
VWLVQSREHLRHICFGGVVSGMRTYEVSFSYHATINILILLACVEYVCISYLRGLYLSSILFSNPI